MKLLVIIPTHDRTEFYDDAIASVERQTRTADKLVVTGNVGPGIITEACLADKLNAAIEASDCDAFSVLCDDDLLDASFLERTSQVMEEKNVDIVYTDCKIIGRRNCLGSALGEWNQTNIERNTVPLVTSLCRKAAWKRAGGFKDVPFFDWHFWWCCWHTGATAYWLKEPLFIYREHDTQFSKQSDQAKHRSALLDIHNQMRAEFHRTYA